jgi:hypothetical protein
MKKVLAVLDNLDVQVSSLRNRRKLHSREAKIQRVLEIIKHGIFVQMHKALTKKLIEDNHKKSTE